MSTSTVWGVLLERKPYAETDILASLYTMELGKIAVRFIGVRKARGKLKALSEPMVHGEYRLYLRPGSPWATVTGGRLHDSYPAIRADFGKTCAALRLCEMLLRLTPERSPNPRKYRLILEALAALEYAGSKWVSLAFGFKLLELAGFGAPVEAGDQAARDFLLSADFSAIARRPADAAEAQRLEAALESAILRQLEMPLRTSLFQKSLAPARS